MPRNEKALVTLLPGLLYIHNILKAIAAVSNVHLLSNNLYMICPSSTVGQAFRDGQIQFSLPVVGSVGPPPHLPSSRRHTLHNQRFWKKHQCKSAMFIIVRHVCNNPSTWHGSTALFIQFDWCFRPYTQKHFTYAIMASNLVRGNQAERGKIPRSPAGCCPAFSHRQQEKPSWAEAHSNSINERLLGQFSALFIYLIGVLWQPEDISVLAH